MSDVAMQSDAQAPVKGASPKRSWMWRILQIFTTVYSTVVFDLKVYGTRNIPKNGGALLLANHQSYLDPVLISTKLTRPVSFMAKAELFEGGRFFPWLIRTLHAFPVKRGQGDIGAIKQAINRLNEGHVLNMYPEGTRSQTGGIGKILPGVAIIVRKAGVPVIPVIIDGSFRAMPKGTKFPRKCSIGIHYGTPLKVDGLKPTEVVELIDTTLHDMMKQIRGKKESHG